MFHTYSNRLIFKKRLGLIRVWELVLFYSVRILKIWIKNKWLWSLNTSIDTIESQILIEICLAQRDTISASNFYLNKLNSWKQVSIHQKSWKLIILFQYLERLHLLIHLKYFAKLRWSQLNIRLNFHSLIEIIDSLDYSNPNCQSNAPKISGCATQIQQ